MNARTISPETGRLAGGHRSRWGVAWLGIGSVLALAAVPACLLQLEHEIACGDGFVDEQAGEECDPADPPSFEDACSATDRKEGIAACDPETCTIINTREQCATCGDDELDPDLGEECDGDKFNGQGCDVSGTLQCNADCTLDFSACEKCGNGIVDEGEECDTAQVGGFVQARPCAGRNLGQPDEILPLPSPFENKPFTSGETAACRDDCRLERINCGYCGNGVREDATPVDVGISIAAEWCDDDNFDADRLAEEFGEICTAEPGTRPNVGCEDNCASFTPQRPGAPACCLVKNQPCPEAGDTLQCCYGYDNPDEDQCGPLFDGLEVRRVCR